MNSEPDVAIIGGGAAGIGAARALAGKGLSIVLLEATDRLGGRAWTAKTSAGPLDLGCGWLHSADRNPWTKIAAASGFRVVEGPSAWGQQYRGLGFSVEDQKAARQSASEFQQRLRERPPASDRASDGLLPDGKWNAYLQAISGFGNGDELERISARDYMAYETASTNSNWRVASGYGALVSSSIPGEVEVSLRTPIEEIRVEGERLELRTPLGTLWPRSMIVTVSTNVIAGDLIAWPDKLQPWQEAASCLPLGNNEKLFLEIVGGEFEPETHVIGNPTDVETGSYYMRPMGLPVIECFLGGARARSAARAGADEAFERALDELRSLFGSAACASLKPLVSSDWTNMRWIGGAYSHALPLHSGARQRLATPFQDRIFFAGEATHPTDFSTAHGALESGIRAAGEVLNVLAANFSMQTL